ncbi:alpha/beta hydrolase [Cytophagaceae bacterium ABcell3]|nr:alpha/beta hydrolase [Cytophagaceae bacterium ABcell3]
MSNTTFSYVDKGSGAVIVLLHGFCEDKTLWNKFIEKLSNEFRVIAPDLSGHGNSPLPEQSISMESMAIEIKQLLDYLDIGQCVMAGHSMGGYVALAFAEKYPETLKGICLFHSSAFADTNEKKEARNKTISFIKKHGVNAFADSFVAPLFSLDNRKEPYVTEVNKMVKNTAPQSIMAAAAAMRDRPDRTHVLKAIDAPVLFIAGKEDNAAPLEKILQQCTLPKESFLHVLSDTGHMGMFEKEQETVGCLQAFLHYIYNF